MLPNLPEPVKNGEGYVLIRLPIVDPDTKETHPTGLEDTAIQDKNCMKNWPIPQTPMFP